VSVGIVINIWKASRSEAIQAFVNCHRLI